MVAWLATFALVFCFGTVVLAEGTADANAAFAIEQKIAGLMKEQLVYNSCDDALANLNSGGASQVVVDGANKYTSIHGGGTELCVGICGSADLTNYSSLEFDFRYSPGVTPTFCLNSRQK